MENNINDMKNVTIEILSKDNIDNFCTYNKWLDKNNFINICRLYGFPDNQITLIIENYYIDAAYRDIYYNYWSSFHFDWPRHCRRLFLFKNAHNINEFYDLDRDGKLNSDFLGTIVIRPAYSNKADHTFGRTLLNPYKMTHKNYKGKLWHPFLYLKTTKYKIRLLGNTYTVNAFPFCSQDGVVMKCAETAVYELCDFASMFSPIYSRVLPSDIQSKLKLRLPERILPSHGLYCSDISYLLREFGFSPMIYAETDNKDRAVEDLKLHDLLVGQAKYGESSESEDISTETMWDYQHNTDFKDWFHYYVESAIPLLTITSPSQEEDKHAILVIGHGRNKKEINECNIYHLGNLPCIDTAQLYESYIVQDDNQIPYTEEILDQFTQKRNYRLDAFIVPLDKHVFLEASSAIDTCDVFIAQESEMIQQAIGFIADAYKIQEQTEENPELKQLFGDICEGMKVSKENPITIRYFLANSAEYKQYRMANTHFTSDKMFYADVPMPKAVWIAEISTFKCYEMGYVFAEVVIDATASNMSQVNSIILIRMAHLGAFRMPKETYDDFINKLKEMSNNNIELSCIFRCYSNFDNEEWLDDEE